MRIYNLLFVLLTTLFVACNTNNDTLPPPQQPPTQQQMALVAEFTVNDGDTIFTCTGFTNPLLVTNKKCENYKIFYINNRNPHPSQKVVSVAVAVNTDSLEESPITTDAVSLPFNFENQLEMSFKYWKQSKRYVNGNTEMANMISDVQYIGIVSQTIDVWNANGNNFETKTTQTLSMRHFKVSGEMSCDFAEDGFPNNKVGVVTIEYNMSILLPR